MACARNQPFCHSRLSWHIQTCSRLHIRNIGAALAMLMKCYTLTTNLSLVSICILCWSFNFHRAFSFIGLYTLNPQLCLCPIPLHRHFLLLGCVHWRANSVYVRLPWYYCPPVPWPLPPAAPPYVTILAQVIRTSASCIQLYAVLIVWITLVRRKIIQHEHAHFYLKLFCSYIQLHTNIFLLTLLLSTLCDLYHRHA